MDSYNASVGDSVLLPETSVSGWEFIGWSLDPNATVGMNDFQVKDCDVTLYALFRKGFSIICYSGENMSVREVVSRIPVIMEMVHESPCPIQVL